MPIRRSILVALVIAAMVIGLVWFGKERPKTRQESTGETNVPAATASAEFSKGDVQTNRPVTTAPATVSPQTSSVHDKGEQMREGLAEFNDVEIEFYARLEDQFGGAIPYADVKFEIPFNNGSSVGVQRGTIKADQNGAFAITGYKGKSLSVVPVKTGYALASLNGGGVYSHLWSEAERVHPDMNRPAVIKMWKLQGDEPLVDLAQEHRIPFTSLPLRFDLVTGQIVSAGGDITVTLNRPPGEISEQHPQNWSIDVQTVGGGFIPASEQEWRTTYFAPDIGYEKSGSFTNNRGITSLGNSFFVKSRNGQVYSKLGLTININEMPDGFLKIRLRGVANTNSSRNWEADPNTIKPADR